MTAGHDLDRTITGWLRDQARPAPARLLDAVATAAENHRQRPRLVAWTRGAGTWPSSPGQPVLRLLLAAALLTTVALVGIVATAGDRRAPAPTPPQPSAMSIPGFRLLADEESGVSLQVPVEWTRPIAGSLGRRQLLGAAMGHGGVTVHAVRDAGELAQVMDALVEPHIARGEVMERLTGFHGTNRAVRVRISRSIYYLVERSANERFLVNVVWDTVPDLGATTDQILSSFNVNGVGPVVVEPVALSGPIPGFRLLADEEPGVSLQAPIDWDRGAVALPGRRALLEAGYGFGSVALYRVPETGDLADVMDAVLAREPPGGLLFTSRVEGLHDGHRAIRVVLERSEYYLVERSATDRFLLHVYKDAPENLGITSKIFGSFNVDGTEAVETVALEVLE